MPSLARAALALVALAALLAAGVESTSATRRRSMRPLHLATAAAMPLACQPRAAFKLPPVCVCMFASGGAAPGSSSSKNNAASPQATVRPPLDGGTKGSFLRPLGSLGLTPPGMMGQASSARLQFTVARASSSSSSGGDGGDEGGKPKSAEHFDEAKEKVSRSRD